MTYLDMNGKHLFDEPIDLNDIFEDQVTKVDYHDRGLIVTLDGCPNPYLFSQMSAQIQCVEKSMEKMTTEDQEYFMLSASAPTKMKLFFSTDTKLFFTHEENDKRYFHVYDFTPKNIPVI